MGALLAALALAPFWALLAQSADQGRLVVLGSDGKPLMNFTGSHALVIGESVYTNGWARLDGVREDTLAIRQLFTEQGFSVKTLENLNSRDLKAGIAAFFDEYGYEQDARLIVYYAGHDHTLKLDNTRDMGYIVPVDSPNPRQDELGFKRTAIAMEQFNTWATQIESRHVLLIFDSCFSGSVFATSRAAPGIIDYKIANPVRQFIASGAANETVPDKSIFRAQLEAGLRNREADLNRDGYVSGSELGDFLQSTVVNYSRNSQHPQYGKIRNPALDKGDFVFAVGLGPPSVTVAPPVIPTPKIGEVRVATGSLEIATITPGTVEIRGTGLNQKQALPAWGSFPISNIQAGTYTVKMTYTDGKTEEKTVEVGRAESKKLEFSYRIAAAPVAPAPQPAAVTPVAPPTVRPAPIPADFVKINGGTFTMGSPASEKKRLDRELQHQVTVSSFYMGKYEVTQKEYKAIMGKNPSYFTGDNRPVENVSWFKAVEYCNARSRKEGLILAYTISGGSGDNRTVTWNRNANGYRLPTEAEWEYACRAGTTTPFSTGSTITTNQANYNWIYPYPYNNKAKGTYREMTIAVGSFAANAWGVYDLHGNVEEWCWDWYGDYSSGSQTDPQGASSGTNRVIRGGDWFDGGQNLRSAFRALRNPSRWNNDLGFRLVRPSL
ncbi:MAG: SUMF1/EgtB/PvdO family nonheme iron enzyme [Treponema sp.]|jgi:formylglycine-generating enzyme required for sulfatase activity|nr:SUMF1/EgtB/PvdO family nonheme iron enzyme [Treponema sp.]